MHTTDDVKDQIARIKEFTSDELVHYTKIISSKSTNKEKKLYAPLAKAIEKERKARGDISAISVRAAKIVVTVEERPTNTAKGSDYP